MIRFFDFIFSILGLLVLSPLIFILFVIGVFDTGSPFFIQQRIGRNKKIFFLVKFRSMSLNTQSVATHLVNKNAVTRFGSFLRKSKLDELPQLWNVLVGDMSLVGPRPNLPNQTELLQERESRKVYSVRPGITGLAQIQEIDMSTPQLLAETDASMIQNLNLFNYFKIIIATVTGKGFGDRIKA
ncbi:MAG: sugar transferase [Sediminibacterium sp.]|nr:sugar transferase [Sediminibacterium sp.]